MRLLVLREQPHPATPPSLVHCPDGTLALQQALRSWVEAARPSAVPALATRTAGDQHSWWRWPSLWGVLGYRDAPGTEAPRRTSTQPLRHSSTEPVLEPFEPGDPPCGERRTSSERRPRATLQRACLGEAFVATVGRPSLGWEIGADAAWEFFKAQRAPPDRWRLSQANDAYAVCDTYPRLLVVPAGANDELLRQAALARSRGRLPVLTYYHRGRGSALLRCAQPRGAGAPSDQVYLELCRQAVHKSAGLTIYDCRSQAAALSNSIIGGGQEAPLRYHFSPLREGDVGQATVLSMDMPNIHEMLSSWQQLQALVECSDMPDHKLLQRLGDTQWLDHCRRITEAAVTVARSLAGRAESQPPTCVVVHCSDGWDRTAQVCSLAQLLADRRFRTRRGLCHLVEKDWTRFGHRFADRCVTDGSKASPIFLQWLFCVAAVVTQFPEEFDYDDADLMLLADLCLCGYIGTFQFNSEREAVEADAAALYTSVWAVWLEAGDRGRRRRHGRDSEYTSAGELLLPVTSLKRFALWEWALRFDDVAFSRQKAYSQRAGEGNAQRLGRGLVRMLRDSGSAVCRSCKGAFGVVRRRHHCRGCGLLFCSACTQWRAQLPHPLYTGGPSGGAPSGEAPALLGAGKARALERVCRRCFELLRTQSGQASALQEPGLQKSGPARM